jgi:RNA polymerase sigma-B factor
MTVDQLSEIELFKCRDDRACMDELMKRYDHLAQQLARKFAGRGAEIDDLEQVARIALLNAATRFDVDRGVKFSTYAGRTIIGEIKHFFRANAWSLRVPRSLQELWLRTSKATQELNQKLGRSPSIHEIAEFLDVDDEQILEALDAGGSLRPASLDTPVGDDSSTTIGDMVGRSDPSLSDAAEWADLEPAFGKLDDRERTIVYMRFFEGRTQNEIADVMGVSQVHVSRLLRGALETIRLELDASEPRA